MQKKHYLYINDIKRAKKLPKPILFLALKMSFFPPPSYVMKNTTWPEVEWKWLWWKWSWHSDLLCACMMCWILLMKQGRITKLL